MSDQSERRSLQAAYLAVSVAVASVLSTLVWVWAHASWKVSGTAEHARYTALGMFAFTTFLCWRGVTRRLTRWVRVIAFTLPVLFPSCAGCATTVSDINPGGGVNFMFADRTPDNSSGGLLLMLLVAALLGFSALVPLRRAALTERAAETPRIWLMSGTWLLLATAATALSAALIPLQLGRWLLPHIALGCCMLLVGFALRRPERRRLALAGGAVVAVLTAALGYGSRFTAVGRCESICDGLVMRASAAIVHDYPSREVTLERVTCDTTFQYIGQATNLLLGHGRDGSELRGAALFAHLSGKPLERARAACELLLPDECDEVVLPGSPYAPLSVLGQPLQAPFERDGKLVFYGYRTNHMYGYGTSVGAILEARRYTVNLRSFVTSVERAD